MKIQVTQQDIDEGVRGDCQRCPVALALNRSIRKEVEVSVDGATIELDEYSKPFAEGYYEIRVPDEVARFIHRFDGRFVVEPGEAMPFEFEIEIPERFLKNAVL